MGRRERPRGRLSLWRTWYAVSVVQSGSGQQGTEDAAGTQADLKQTRLGAVKRPALKDMKTWTKHLGHSKLRSFTDADGHFWLEQNPGKPSAWGRFARKGHDVAWEFEGHGGGYTGRMLIDGEIYTPAEATKKFLKTRADGE
jgi:hypothetical protein